MSRIEGNTNEKAVKRLSWNEKVDPRKKLNPGTWKRKEEKKEREKEKERREKKKKDEKNKREGREGGKRESLKEAQTCLTGTLSFEVVAVAVGVMVMVGKTLGLESYMASRH